MCISIFVFVPFHPNQIMEKVEDKDSNQQRKKGRKEESNNENVKHVDKKQSTNEKSICVCSFFTQTNSWKELKIRIRSNLQRKKRRKL